MSPRLLLLLPLALLAACPGDTVDDDSASGDDDTAGDDDDDDDGDDDDDTTPAWDTSVTGVVQDAGGEPLPGLPIAFCHEICLTAQTAADGSFGFSGFEPMSYVVENLGTPAGDVVHWGKFFDIAHVVEGVPFDLGIKVVPRIDDVETGLEGDQQLEPIDGFHVGFDADTLEVPPTAEALTFGLVHVPESQWPIGGLPLGWTPIVAAAAAVWDLHAVDGFSVAVDLELALPAETPVAFLVADYDISRLSGEFVVEAAELSEDGLRVQTPAAGGLDRATLWIVAAQLPPPVEG